MRYSIRFRTGTVAYCFEEPLEGIAELAPIANTFIITDENVLPHLPSEFDDYHKIVIPAGEQAKSWATVEYIVAELAKRHAHRDSFLLGIGGGVVTDITGFVGSIYMRGIGYGYLPTSLLAMTDAAIGGKTGINFGGFKNLLGTIRQPKFIWFHPPILRSLPGEEWCNGFAEIIKYGHIADTRILPTLEQHDIRYFQKHPLELSELISGCIQVKNKIAEADEDEKGVRRYLNFGHTVGHALESLYNISHGQGVGLGMVVATKLSTLHGDLPPETIGKLIKILSKYDLPTTFAFDPEAVMEKIALDKKRSADAIQFILLKKPGIPFVKKLSFQEIADGFKALA